jgi:phosphoribosylaminoimidazole-succinocarboxamide synthase
MKTRKLVYEGKGKNLYEGPEPGTLVQYFKDDATAQNGKKTAVLEGKGVLNNRISEYLMSRLTEIGVRNVAAGSMAKRFDMEEGSVLPRSIIEFYLKNDKLQDPMVTEEHITAFNWATPQEIDEIVAMAIRINDFLSGLFLGAGIKLVDMKIEFGRLWENDMMRVILADEISPDSMRLWDIRTSEKLDKDRFRRDLGGVTEAYSEVAKRLGILNELQNTERKGPVLVK